MRVVRTDLPFVLSFLDLFLSVLVLFFFGDFPDLSFPSFSAYPVNPHPLNFGGAIHPLNLGSGVSEALCFTVSSGGRPLNLGGEIVTPEFRGYGFTG